MRYFTITTLILLASNAYASESSLSNDTLAPESTFSIFGDYFREAAYKVTHLLSKRKNLIEAQLVVPNAYTTDKLVSIDQNLCISKTLEEYSKLLFSKQDSQIIEKIIFCPDAPAFLKELSSGKLLANINLSLLKDLIASLLLRQATLEGLYSQAYVEYNYMHCYHELFKKVYSNDPAKAEHWPCTESNCTAEMIQKSFTDFANNFQSCKNVLESQLLDYANKVSNLTNSTTTKTFNSFELREAIRENLDSSSSITTGLKAAFDKISESNREAAAAKISEILNEIKAILKNFNQESTIFADAEADFKKKLSGATAKEVEVSATETLKEDPATETMK